MCLEYPWIIENWRWGGPSSISSGALWLAAPAPPHPRVGPLPSPLPRNWRPWGESPGQSVRVSLRGPGGGASRAARGWRGRAPARAAGARRPRLHNKAPAPVTSHRPGPADGRGTRAQPPLPLPGGPGWGRRAGAGFVVRGPFRVVRTLSFPQQPNGAPGVWAGWDYRLKLGRAVMSSMVKRQG